MKRRPFLVSVSASMAALAGCTAISAPQADSRVGYPEEEVVYERDGLQLRLLQETVRPGEPIEFEVTNTGDSMTVLGCHDPWAIEKRSDGEWQLVTWTADRYYDMCATGLAPGDSLVERITPSGSAFERSPDGHAAELRPGQYRFLLLGPTPYLALDFTVSKPE